MTIEFHCPRCQNLLRVQDESAGKQAQCPECGEVSQIPGEASAPAFESGNPFQSPQTESPMFRSQVEAGAIVPTRIDLGEVFGHAWVIFKDQWQTVFGAVLLVWVINFVVSMAVSTTISASDNNAALILILQLASMILSAYLSIGIIKVLIGVARGQQTSFSDLFTDGKLILPYLLASLLVSAIVSIGFLLLVVPGVILLLMLSQYAFLIVDRQMGVIDSLKVSAEVTKGNRLTLLAIGLVAILGGGVLIAITCGIATIVVVPYFFLVGIVAYLKMTGQPTSAM